MISIKSYQLDHICSTLENHLQIQITSETKDRLNRYQQWLRLEAIPAGAVGPQEAEHLPERHIVDSLLFSLGWQDQPTPTEVWDLGTGVGLPGIPLAILYPSTDLVLCDRSETKIRLLRRATRILELHNTKLKVTDIREGDRSIPFAVSRACIPPPQLRPALERLLSPGGRAVIGGSYQRPPEYPGYRTLPIPTEILDKSGWLLIMDR